MNNSKLQKHTIWKKATALLLTAALLTGSIPAYGGASEVHAEEADAVGAEIRAVI